MCCVFLKIGIPRYKLFKNLTRECNGHLLDTTERPQRVSRLATEQLLQVVGSVAG